MVVVDDFGRFWEFGDRWMDGQMNTFVTLKLLSALDN